MTDYPPVLEKLLTLGDGSKHRDWPNYLELGIGKEHIPDLIRMATDQELNFALTESIEVWAPAHACRALGQLRAEEAIDPLMSLFHELEDDDWAQEELPEVYGMIGPSAIPAIRNYLADSSHGLYPRITAANSLERIGSEHPDARDECVNALSRQLEKHKENDPSLNGFLVAYLLDLNAMEAVQVIESAYAAGCVDPGIAGDWKDIKEELGL